MSANLSIYLIRKENQEAGQVISETTPVREYPINVRAGEQWLVYAKDPEASYPDWSRFFENYLDPDVFGQSSSPAAVLLVPVEDRLFALTFGTGGKWLLYPDAWEDRFGFRVTINAVDHRKLKSLDKDRVAAEARREREQTARERTPDYFGVDPSRDILRSVTGAPRNAVLGTRMTGRDHLRVTGVPVKLGGLQPLLSRYLEQHQSTTYKEHFSWIDHIAEVTDKTQIEELTVLLAKQLADGKTDDCLLTAPEAVEWHRINGFKYSHTRSPLRNDLSISDFLTVVPESLDADLLGRLRVRAQDTDGQTIYDWPAYRCLVAEIADGENTYVLNGGTWFKVSSNFAERVNKALTLIPVVTPPYLGLYESTDASELTYNRRMAEESGGEVALMDMKLVRCPTETFPLEFCDLYHRDQEIVCVKHYGGSSVLSHLFFQGLNAAEVFLKDPGFRQNLNGVLPPTHRLADPEQEINPQDYRVIFAVISSKPGPLVLPFFSRISLRYVSEQLRLFRFKMGVAKISLSKEAQMLKKASRKRIRKTF